MEVAPTRASSATPARPCGIAAFGQQLFWTNNGTGTIARANTDGTGVNQAFIAIGASQPCGVAVDSLAPPPQQPGTAGGPRGPAGDRQAPRRRRSARAPAKSSPTAWRGSPSNRARRARPSNASSTASGPRAASPPASSNASNRVATPSGSGRRTRRATKTRRPPNEAFGSHLQSAKPAERRFLEQRDRRARLTLSLTRVGCQPRFQVEVEKFRVEALRPASRPRRFREGRGFVFHPALEVGRPGELPVHASRRRPDGFLHPKPARRSIRRQRRRWRRVDCP